MAKKKVLTSALVPGRRIRPRIKLLDHTPSSKDPYNHIHCDVCEGPKDKVAYFESYDHDDSFKGTEHYRHRLRICKECLEKGLRKMGS